MCVCSQKEREKNIQHFSFSGILKKRKETCTNINNYIGLLHSLCLYIQLCFLYAKLGYNGAWLL